MIDIIKACTDLGTHVCGAELGPDTLLKDFKHKNVENIYQVTKQDGKKELDKNNKRKNIDRINIFNEELYSVVSRHNQKR